MSDELLELALTDPNAARQAATAVLENGGESLRIAQAHRALGVVDRDNGRMSEALAHMASALRIALQAGDPVLVSDVRGTFGATLVLAGQVTRGLDELSLAIDGAEGEARAMILFRRGICLGILGRSQRAIPDFESASEIFRHARNRTWLARTLNVLGEHQLNAGFLGRALGSFDESANLHEGGAVADLVWLKLNLARVHFLQGDVPLALRLLEESKALGIHDGRQLAVAVLRHASVYLACGMAQEAAEELGDPRTQGLPPGDAAECTALRAEAMFLARDWNSAIQTSQLAAARLRELGADSYALRADLIHAQSRAALGQSTDLIPDVRRLALRLDAIGSQDAAEAWLTLGTLSRGRAAISSYRRAAHWRRDPNDLVAATGWLAHAHELDAASGRGVLHACGRGLAAIDQHRTVMGSSELRAALTHRGRELAEVALRNAASDPRTLLVWSERWRATSLEQLPVTAQEAVSPALAMLRDSGRRLAEARASGESTEALEKERRSLERKVRAEHHQQRSQQSEKAKRFNAAELVAEVADGAFIELVDVDGILHVIVVSKGRVRRVIAGETKAALELAEAGRFALRRAARTNRYAPGDLGQRFQDAVLGNAVRMLPDGPVMISPTAALHGAPFALMPALMNRPFSLVPSAAQWMRARAVPTPRNKRLALVSGPGLLTGGAEVASLAKAYPDATILRGADATVAATMKAIDGAKLAHLATHGTFRADSPLFSALEMADGPLSVYELERLKRAPYRTILSACDSGVLAPVGAQEVLGLASALFSLGSAGLLCSIAEVNDEVTADLMMQIHASLDAKRTPAEALAEVRESAGPIEQATAAAFVALGV